MKDKHKRGLLAGFRGSKVDPVRARLGARRGSGREVLGTQNESWGFWGTMRRGLGPEVETYGGHPEDIEAAVNQAWRDAFGVLLDSGLSPVQAREFLDSRMGRHFADCWIGSRAEAVSKVATFTGWWRREGGGAVRTR